MLQQARASDCAYATTDRHTVDVGTLGGGDDWSKRIGRRRTRYWYHNKEFVIDTCQDVVYRDDYSGPVFTGFTGTACT